MLLAKCRIKDNLFNELADWSFTIDENNEVFLSIDGLMMDSFNKYKDLDPMICLQLTIQDVTQDAENIEIISSTCFQLIKK